MGSVDINFDLLSLGDIFHYSDTFWVKVADGGARSLSGNFVTYSFKGEFVAYIPNIAVVNKLKEIRL